MLDLSMKTLYQITSLEGEGLGTAYAYYADLRLLEELTSLGKGVPKSILIAGLPEKYSFGLEFIMFGYTYGCKITVVDERSETLNKFRFVLDLLWNSLNLTSNFRPQVVKADKLSDLGELGRERYDLSISMWVLQRLLRGERRAYMNLIKNISRHAIFFIPNEENRLHTRFSHVKTMALQDLVRYCGEMIGYRLVKWGYNDVPPFPPGLKIPESTKDVTFTKIFLGEILSKLLEKWYGLVELKLPPTIKREVAHSGYVALSSA